MGCFLGVGQWRSCVLGGGSLDLHNIQLTWRDRKGTSLGVASEPRFYRAVTLSPDSTLAALTLQSTASQADASSVNIWLLDFSRGGSGTRFTFGGIIGRAVWSPDGNRIVFTSRW